jgi:hypothetical protein
MNQDIAVIKQERSRTLENDFIAPEPQVAGRKLYPFTAGRKLLLKKLRNELLSGKDLSTMIDADFAVLEFLYLHTLPSDEATRWVYGDPDEWRDSVVEFACLCSPSMNDEVNAVMAVLQQANLADVDVHQKPQRHNGEEVEPPPNS